MIETIMPFKLRENGAKISLIAHKVNELKSASIELWDNLTC